MRRSRSSEKRADRAIEGYVFRFALNLAHLALCAAAIRLRAAGDIVRRRLAIETTPAASHWPIGHVALL